ncbi:hypothetical protein IMSAGC018_02042 [Lachnospiraceae bacterium]|nr:hypothetical protein IMSAGC018_02042 [Lachnospiraceae bacterium]
MKSLVIVGRLIAFIAFPIGLLFLLFKSFIGLVLITASIVVWNICGHYLDKEQYLEKHNTKMMEEQQKE